MPEKLLGSGGGSGAPAHCPHTEAMMARSIMPQGMGLLLASRPILLYNGGERMDATASELVQVSEKPVQASRG